MPEFEAPVYIDLAKGYRSALIKVLVNEKGNARSKRVEFRASDPSANSYLAFSAIVTAGMDGINKKIDPRSPVHETIYKMNDSKRKSLGIDLLPISLEDSLNALKRDSNFLGSCFHNDL